MLKGHEPTQQPQPASRITRESWHSARGSSAPPPRHTPCLRRFRTPCPLPQNVLRIPRDQCGHPHFPSPTPMWPAGPEASLVRQPGGSSQTTDILINTIVFAIVSREANRYSLVPRNNPDLKEEDEAPRNQRRIHTRTAVRTPEGQAGPAYPNTGSHASSEPPPQRKPASRWGVADTPSPASQKALLPPTQRRQSTGFLIVAPRAGFRSQSEFSED